MLNTTNTTANATNTTPATPVVDPWAALKALTAA